MKTDQAPSPPSPRAIEVRVQQLEQQQAALEIRVDLIEKRLDFYEPAFQDAENRLKALEACFWWQKRNSKDPISRSDTRDA